MGRSDKASTVGYLGGPDAGVSGMCAIGPSHNVGALGTPDDGVSGSNPASGTSGSLGAQGAGVEGKNAKSGTGGALGLANAGIWAKGTDVFPALMVEGAVFFKHCGAAVVPKDKSSVRVTGLKFGQFPQAGLALLQAYRPGVAVAATVVDMGAGTVTIYLTKKVTQATPVVYYLFGYPMN